MGGDEFAIVLPNVAQDESQLVGQRVLEALNDRDAFRLQIRASLGVSWQRIPAGDGHVLLRRADEAMYRAKAAGGGLMFACP
jgi:diguanylate cyclase (GGDEF)-like protein